MVDSIWRTFTILLYPSYSLTAALFQLIYLLFRHSKSTFSSKCLLSRDRQ